MRIWMLAGILFWLTACLAQSDKYTAKVLEICPSADIIGMETKTDYIEIDYLCQGVLYEMGLDANKEVIFIETESRIPQQVMSIIQRKLDKKYYGWVVDEYALVETPDTSFYKAELIRSGVEENVYFTLDGKYYKAKNTVVNESWDAGSLNQSSYYASAPYDFLNPDKTMDLPEILKEISGIALAADGVLFCIQDETGIVFQYDVQKDAITGMVRFTDKGDFEDISVKNDTAYVLRSDGTLFYFNHKHFDGKVKQVVIPLNCLNIEGLFFSHPDHSVFIACKDPLVTDYGDNRTIYRVNADRLARPEAAVTIKLEEINEKMKKHYPFALNRQLQFNPSAIAVHPLTKELYVLSAMNRFMAIFDEQGLSRIFPLPAEIYYKPEGIAFSGNGDLYISSEGMKNGYVGGQIFYFRYR